MPSQIKPGQQPLLGNWWNSSQRHQILNNLDRWLVEEEKKKEKEHRHLYKDTQNISKALGKNINFKLFFYFRPIIQNPEVLHLRYCKTEQISKSFQFEKKKTG